MKGVSAGEFSPGKGSFSPAGKAPNMSKHHKMQKMKNMINTADGVNSSKGWTSESWGRTPPGLWKELSVV